MTSLADRAHVLRAVRCLSRSAPISSTRIVRYGTRYSASSGAANGLPTCMRTERGKSKLVQTRGVIERRWRAIQHALTRRGMTVLAEEVLRFVGEMPPPMTDREQLARDLSSGRSRLREITPLFSR